MKSEPHRTSQLGGSAPATLGFNAIAPEWLRYGADLAAPAVPAAESTLGSHPCVALSSAQVLPEWITPTPPVNSYALNGAQPLNSLSHSRGSLQAFTCSLPCGRGDIPLCLAQLSTCIQARFTLGLFAPTGLRPSLRSPT